MAKAWIPIVPPGVHQAPQGRLHATPARVAGWVAKHRRMRAAGIRIPLCWGHQPASVPVTPEEKAQRAYELAHFNAGYLEDMRVGASGWAEGLADVPGAELDADGNLVHEVTLPDGSKVKGAIGEVSAAIRDWRDGQGRAWPDSIIHVALTPLPVVAGQGGFRPAEAAGEPEPVYLSNASFLYELGGSMAEENDRDEKKPKDEAPAGDAPPAADPAPEPEPTPEEVAAEQVGGSSEDEMVKAASLDLAKLGVVLPEDTDSSNFLDRLLVGLKTACHHREVAEAEEAEEPEAPESPPQEEQRPVMLSLATATTEGERRLLAREQERHRKASLARVERLVKGQFLPVADADRLRGAFAGYELSLDAAMEPVSATADVELSIWEKAFGQSEQAKRAHVRRAKEEPRPGGGDAPDAGEIEARAARVSRGK